MRIDFRKDSAKLRNYSRKRIRDYPRYVNDGPGKDEDPITLITFGYYYNQAGWVALIFDTRTDAEIDGKWTLYMSPSNVIAFDHWCRAFNDMFEKDSRLTITLQDGSKKTLDATTDMEEIAECFGSMIRDVVLELQSEGLFDKLPLATDLTFCIEEFDGFFGWSDPDPEAESRKNFLAKLDGNVFQQPADVQIDHWINVLDRVARGAVIDAERLPIATVDHAIDRLGELGDQAVVPMLKFVRKWAGKPEFEGDRPKRKLTELPMHEPAVAVLMSVCESKHDSPEVESLLRQILRKSIKANAERRLWGIIPAWTARCLFQRFDGYPEPVISSSCNELQNRDQFTGRRPRK